jgi:Prasinovirus endonuclease VII
MKRVFTDEQKERRKATKAAWRRANREKCREQARAAYYRATPEQIEARRARGRKRYPKRSVQQRAYQKIYRTLNQDRKRELWRQWRKENPEKVREMWHRWAQRYPEKVKERGQQWVKNNPDKQRARAKRWKTENTERYRFSESKRKKERYSSDPNYRLRLVLRACLRDSLTRQPGAKKIASTIKLVGCDIDWLKAWIEIQFQPGMAWENAGLFTWHIDHVRPCASFDLTDPKQQELCFHWTNLQPLWAIDNRIKSDNWEGELAA